MGLKDVEAVFDEVIKSYRNDGKFKKRFTWLFVFALGAFTGMTYFNVVMAMAVNTNLTIEEWKDIHLPKKYDERGILSHSECMYYNDKFSTSITNNTNITDESKAILISIISVYLKFTISMAYYVLHLQAMETYPTCIRQTGLSLGGTIGNTLGVAVPYVIYLGTSINVRYPNVFSAILCGIGMITGIGLPETFNQKLPETLADAATFGADKDIWGKLKREVDSEEAEKPLTELS